MQHTSHKAEPGNYKHVANVDATVHVQQWLNGPHGTPVHDFLSVA